MLNLCNADWAPRFVDFFNGETRTPEYRAHVNEMGEVPVLEFGGKRLSQSGVILDFLAAASGNFGWANGEERREVMRWILWDNHKLTSYIATLRYMLQFAKTGETPVTEFLRGRVKGSLGILNLHLAREPLRSRLQAHHRRPVALRLPLLARRVRGELGTNMRTFADGSNGSRRNRAGCIPTS